jgi:hypothetical protein
MPRIVCVHSAYTSTNTDETVIRAGEEIVLGKRCEEWPGWVWCVAADGWQAWVPDSCLEIHDQHARFTRDYVAREFTVECDDELTVLEDQNGWLFCANSRGEHGWIPANCAETVSAQ